MEIESGLTRSIIGEIRFWDIEQDLTEDEGGVTPSIINALHSSVIQRD